MVLCQKHILKKRIPSYERTKFKKNKGKREVDFLKYKRHFARSCSIALDGQGRKKYLRKTN